jgi:hypothetical protein
MRNTPKLCRGISLQLLRKSITASHGALIRDNLYKGGPSAVAKSATTHPA